MGIGRKLYIEDTGFEDYYNNVYKNSVRKDTNTFADVIECKQKVMTQFKLASRLNKIQSISVLKSGTIRFRTRDLFINNSETGRLRKFFIGKWVIEIDFYSHLKFKPLDRNELGFTSSVWSGHHNTVHPHVSR